MKPVNPAVLKLLYLLVQATDISQQQSAPISMTHSDQTESIEARDETSRLLQDKSGLRLNDYGGFGQLKTLSIRGSDSAEVGVFLEGVRLNSAGQGYFNFSDFDSFGLDEVQILRGGYAYNQSNPGGQVYFRLPQNPSYLTRFEYGSYQRLRLSQLTPVGSLSLERTSGNFLYSSPQGKKRRTNNAGQSVKARAWHRGEDHQVWGQLSVLDQDLPGSVSFLTPDDFIQMHSGILAGQKSWRNWEFSIWNHSQNQESVSSGVASQNISTFSGVRVERKDKVASLILIQQQLENSFDYLMNDQLSESHRYTAAYGLRALGSLTEGQDLQAYGRVEYLSDLKRPISLHSGIGGKHQIAGRPVFLRWNSSWISRAPTFYELYFRSPFFNPNPRLKRQQSLQGDLGLDWIQAPFRISHTAFLRHTRDIIQTVQLSPLKSQSENSGRGLAWGVENQWEVQAVKALRLSLQYQYEISEIGERQRVYSPNHRLHFSPTWTPTVDWELGLHYAYRSPMRAPDFYTEPRIDEQHRLDLQAEYQKGSWTFELALRNLLLRAQEEIKEYPLPEELHFSFGAQKKF